jgi:putative transposase
MKLTLQIQLLPDAETAHKLSATMTRFNQACSWLAERAFEALQQKYYYELRAQFGLSAQMAALAIRHVGGTYSRDKSIKPVFRQDAAMPYDSRILSFKGIDRVSLLTLAGRVIVPFLMGAYQHERFTDAKGQCDLVRRKDGKWFLLVTVDLPSDPIPPTAEFIGVDMGVVNLAADSDGKVYTNAETEAVRQKNNQVRRSLQRKATQQKKAGKRPRQVRRKLKKLAGRERRFKSNTNHIISKRIVAEAKGTGRGVAVEDLKGIRERIRFRQEQRDKASKWAFGELHEFIAYKCEMHCVDFVAVDPRNTSPECGHIAKASRTTRGTFECRECGHFEHADVAAAKNISRVAAVTRREVSAADSRLSRGTSPQ